MNVIANNPAAADGTDAAAAGVLVVQNGRMRGARRPLAHPLTLIGQAQGCEVRLNVDGVRPLHCVIALGPEGYVLRDLSGGDGTLVNGLRATVQGLHHGDLIAVGPFQFLIEVPDSMRPENLRRQSTALKNEREAVRIQAAAVAAQQAGLTEEEVRLEQRRLALQRQEEQLVARLDDRQRDLKDQEERLRQDLSVFQTERQAEEQRLTQLRETLGHTQAEQEKGAAQVTADRKRLTDLRNRLRQRWRNHLSGQQTVLKKRERQLACDQNMLRAEEERLERERTELTENRLRFNGELEVGRRKLQEEWQELGVAQQQWETTLNAERSGQARRQQELEKREEMVAHAQRELQEKQNFWEQHRSILELDVDGLENRIRNQRQRLRELEQDQARLGIPIQAATLSAPSRTAAVAAQVVVVARAPAHAGGLECFAGLVADQRWHLLEQWERLLVAHQGWEKDHETLLALLEDAGRGLDQRERRLDERAAQLQVQERVLDARVAQLQTRQESLTQLRCSLEGWQARLTLQSTEWEAWREEVLTSVRAREEAVAAQLHRAEELHRKRTQRLRNLFQDLRKAQVHTEQVRLEYAGLWKTCQEQHQALTVEHNAVTKQTVALERFRLDALGQQANQVAAEKRLERLQRNCNAINAEAERQIERERQALLAENQRLDERARSLAERENELMRRNDLVLAQLSDLESQQATLTETEARRQQELERLRSQHHSAEKQVHGLRDEVERLAQMLLEEADASGNPKVEQAA